MSFGPCKPQRLKEAGIIGSTVEEFLTYMEERWG
jgi:hypothetical protein